MRDNFDALHQIIVRRAFRCDLFIMRNLIVRHLTFVLGLDSFESSFVEFELNLIITVSTGQGVSTFE
jgi:hypothetical protein